MDNSRHEGGADVLASTADLYIALGVRIRERPGARWMIEMHPRTRAEFDVPGFNARFGVNDVRICASRYVAPGEYRLLQRGFGTGVDTGDDAAGRWSDSGD